MTKRNPKQTAVPDYQAFDDLTIQKAPWWAQVLVRFQGADLATISAIVIFSLSPRGLWSTLAGMITLLGLAAIRASPELIHGTNSQKRG